MRKEGTLSMKLLKIIFNILLLIVTLIVPKSKKYIVIGGWEGKRFADNSKGMFEYLTENMDNLGLVRVFWYTKDKKIYQQLKEKGYDVLFGLNLRSIFWHLRSKIHFIDQNPHDILGFLSIRTTRINLWHGVPLKKIGIDIIPGYKPKNELLRKFSSGGFWRDQYIVAPSQLAASLLGHAMEIKKEKWLIASYPRNSRLYNNYLEKKDDISPFNVYYLPTFRNQDDNNRNPILDSDIEDFNSRLKENNIVFHVKPHFASKSDWNKLSQYSNIDIIASQEDVYGALLETDLLITDYSSVYFDYLLTNKPILFFPYDLDFYAQEERGFYMDYDQITPGKKVYSYEEFVDNLETIRKDMMSYIKQYEKQYQEVRNITNQYQETPNYDAILELLK